MVSVNPATASRPANLGTKLPWAISQSSNLLYMIALLPFLIVSHTGEALISEDGWYAMNGDQPLAMDVTERTIGDTTLKLNTGINEEMRRGK